MHESLTMCQGGGELSDSLFGINLHPFFTHVSENQKNDQRPELDYDK